MTRVPQVPHELAATPVGSIPIRRVRVVGIPEPPGGIELLAGRKTVGFAWKMRDDFRRRI